jgi:hypothetical protein
VGDVSARSAARQAANSLPSDASVAEERYLTVTVPLIPLCTVHSYAYVPATPKLRE